MWIVNVFKSSKSWFRRKHIKGKDEKCSKRGSMTPESEGDFEPALAERDAEILKSLGPNISPKLLHFFGDERLLPTKAQRVYGTLEFPLENIRAQRKAETKELAQMAVSRAKAIDEVVRLRPTLEQLSLPVKDQWVPQKALRIFGDEGLNQQASRVLTPTMRRNVTPKTLNVFGETDLLTPKQRQVFGNTIYTPHYEQYDSGNYHCFGGFRESFSCQGLTYSPQLIAA